VEDTSVIHLLTLSEDGDFSNKCKGGARRRKDKINTLFLFVHMVSSVFIEFITSPLFALAIDQIGVGSQNNACSFLQKVPDGSNVNKGKF